ncbi:MULTISPECIES: efflux RND transporter periplasmic adaptor subunit [unclassified Actinoplanes]|uniref:efflux RND transporter periplasmic adaptor subunit n=1 Tax=unclassified Actinoplanes TaxID=2626549 RepID=UPI0012BACE58|nr:MULTISPECIES: efflux RND transporter periplasmic adaptor subunit [unclassified Actinoplanes]
MARAAVFAGATVLLAACTTTGDAGPGSGAGAGDLVVASATAAPATVRVEKREIYQTVRLEGLVEPYDAVPVKAAVDGRFIPAAGVRNGRTVPRGFRLGAVRQCPDEQNAGTVNPAPSASASAGGTAATHCAYRYTAVRAPAAGQLSDVGEQNVAPGAVIANIRPPGFHIRLPVEDKSVLFNFAHPPSSGKAQIVGGPSGLTVRFERRTFDQSSGTVNVFVSAPSHVDLFAGLHAVVVFVTNALKDVDTLPLSAVRGRAEQGEVVVLDQAGHTRTVDVVIGAADDAYVQVSGLDPDADVLVYPLDSNFDR